MARDDSTGSLRFGKPKGRTHPHQRLDAITVRNLRRPGRHADGNGLYLLVDPNGAKRWVLRTVVQGTRRDIGLGTVRLVPLAKAREQAARLRGLAREGGDPLAVRRREQRPVPTFRAAATEVHTQLGATFRNAKHRAQWLASLEAVAFPVFGDRPVDAIASDDVLKALSPVWTTTPETARRVKQRIKVVFEWAKASRYRTGDNPVDGLTQLLGKNAAPPQHHAALPYAQLPAFLQQLRAADALELARLAFEFLILTATRTTEVRLARPAEIDFDTRTWTIPPERMKGHREHQVPLSPRSVAIVERALELAGDSEWVFPGRWLRKPLSEMAFLMLLRRLKRDDITAHGFRSTFRDWAAERTTFPRAVVEAALAHVIKDKTEAAYLRTKFFEQRRELMYTWAAFATSTSADVVPIRA
jgi:integrase